MIAAATTPGLGLRIATIVTLLVLLVGFASIVWTPHPVDVADVANALQDPGAVHWLGTDALGRDVLSLLMKGVLTSFVVAGVAVALGALLGIPLGFAVAQWELAGPTVDAASEFFVTFPALIIAVLFAAAFGPGAPNAMLAIGIVAIPAFAIVTRDGTKALSRLDFVEAGRLAGMGAPDIWRRHIVPEMSRLLIATGIAQLAAGVLAEATLSYLGLGVEPPATSLGLMLQAAQSYVTSKPALAVAPGVAIVVIVLALTVAARGMKQLADPRVRDAA